MKNWSKTLKTVRNPLRVGAVKHQRLGVRELRNFDLGRNDLTVFLSVTGITGPALAHRFTPMILNTVGWRVAFQVLAIFVLCNFETKWILICLFVTFKNGRLFSRDTSATLTVNAAKVKPSQFFSGVIIRCLISYNDLAKTKVQIWQSYIYYLFTLKKLKLKMCP